MRLRWIRKVLFATMGALPIVGGCGESTGLLNPSFVNFAVGGLVPLAPRTASNFVLVRVVNNTPNNIRFVVTAERVIESVDEAGNVTEEIVTETRRLLTFPTGRANELGVLFDCPVVRVGLGEDLDFPTTEPGIFIGAQVAGQEGFGVPGNVNPLDSRAGNFVCGDTLIFQANVAAGTVGNVGVETLVYPGSEQAEDVVIDTFNNARSLINQFTIDDD